VPKGKICVSVCARTADEMLAKIRRAEKYADIVEVRFDCLRSDQIDVLLAILRDVPIETPMIATFRPVSQGGHSTASFDERSNFWRSNHSGFWAADVEEDVARSAFDWFKTITSFHDFDGVPKDLAHTYDEVRATGADIIKIAVHAGDIGDSIPAWHMLEKARSSGRDIVPIAMGEAGKWTRILGLAHGACMTYASLDEGAETAPGQITARDLSEVFRVKDLDLNTQVFGVIGDPVATSLSPIIHNAGFVKARINAVFIPFQVQNVDDLIKRFAKPDTREVEINLGGFAVTMPHKRTIIRHLDEIEKTAEQIGAVNTVNIVDGKLIGYNTDAIGFVTPLIEHFGDLNGLHVAVFGAGGAARACVFALKKENADVTVFARDEAKAAKLAEEFGVRSDSLLRGELPSAIDVVVNATPLGMNLSLQDEGLFNAEQLGGVKLVYDLVTRGEDTQLIREAKKAAVPAISGVEMLLHQGAKQFEIWTGQAAPLEEMRSAIIEKFS